MMATDVPALPACTQTIPPQTHLSLNPRLLSFYQRPDLADVVIISSSGDQLRVRSLINGQEFSIYPIVVVGSRTGCGFNLSCFEPIQSSN